MAQVWSQSYPESLKTETFSGKEVGGEKRDVGVWTDFQSSSALIFIGKYNESKKRFAGRSGGTLYAADGSDFGYRVKVTMNTGPRASVKSKGGDHKALASQTQMNYFDVVRSLFPENPDDFNFSFVGNSTKIKVVSKKPTVGDYLFRFFYIKSMKDGVQVVSKIEYYKSSETKNGPDKTRENSDFKLYEFDGVKVWRPENVWVFTPMGATEIKFAKRDFNVDFGKLSEKSLKDGRPSGWL